MGGDKQGHRWEGRGYKGLISIRIAPLSSDAYQFQTVKQASKIVSLIFRPGHQTRIVYQSPLVVIEKACRHRNKSRCLQGDMVHPRHLGPIQ